MAPILTGRTRGVYLFAMVVGNDGTTGGVGVTMGIWVVDGGVEGGVCSGVVWG